MHLFREPPLDLTAQVTVHDFLTGAPAPSPTSRLQHGRVMAAASSSCVGWVTPSPIAAERGFNVCHDKLFEYVLKAPQITSGDRRPAPESLQEWSDPFPGLADDYFRIKDLGEFESTDFTTLLNPFNHAKVESPSHVEKRPSDANRSDGCSTKRSRLATTSIADLIPQPHFVAGPAGKFELVDNNKITPFRKVQPSPIPPYDTSSITQLLSSGFRRGAWLVPVRGSPPWDGATGAVILDSPRDILGASGSSPSERTGKLSSCRIMWTRESLVSFWKFLVSIQQAKKLGPMSLSFHAASVDLSVNSAFDRILESNNLYCSQPSKLALASSLQARLEGTDFIKVYHDVHYSLYLRNVLDAYRCAPGDVSLSTGPSRHSSPSAKRKSDADDRKIRMLKDTRLVFMDERSKAVFLM